MQIILVGISGPSGAGKSELTKALKHHYGDALVVLSGDRYYKALSETPAGTSLDDPLLWKHEQLFEDLIKLQQGKEIDVPLCDYAQPLAGRKTEKFLPAPIILVDGVILFYHTMLRDLFDVKIFVSAPSGICLARRMKRDHQTRNISYETNVERYTEGVFSAYLNYTKPTKKMVDICIHNGSNHLLDITNIIDIIEKKKGERQSVLRAKM